MTNSNTSTPAQCWYKSRCIQRANPALIVSAGRIHPKPVARKCPRISNVHPFPATPKLVSVPDPDTPLSKALPAASQNDVTQCPTHSHYTPKSDKHRPRVQTQQLTTASHPHSKTQHSKQVTAERPAQSKLSDLSTRCSPNRPPRRCSPNCPLHVSSTSTAY